MADNAVTLTKKQRSELMRSTLESERSSFMSLWRVLNNFILPTSGRFTATDANRGDRRSKDILNGRATIAARTLGSGMMSGITSPARPWFRLTTPDPDLAEHGSVKEWLYTVTERMRSILSRSNFYNKAPTVYQDLGVFGTAGLMMLEDDHKVVRFVDFPIGSFCFALTESDEPGVMTRKFRMTVRQLIKRFGKEKVSQSVRDQADRGHLENWVDVVHVVQSNDELNRNSLYAKDVYPWYSCYYEEGTAKSATDSAFLKESGFEEFPVMFPVWEVRGEDVYGTNSPGITAIGDTKMLQVMERKKLQGLEKMVNPPMVGPTALKSVPTSILPGAITYSDVRDGQQRFQPAHEVDIPIQELSFELAQVEQRINEAFFADLFLMLSYMDKRREGKQPVTAAEIYERHEEKLLALGPVLEQLNQRLLDPIIDRLFNIMDRRGFIPPPPPDIEGQDLKTEYISMMHQAQKSTALGGIRSIVEVGLQIAAVDPSVMDKLNTDRIMEHFNEGAGNPPDIVNSQEEVDGIRQARAQAEEAAQNAERMAQESKAAKDLSQADTTGRNALTDLLSAPPEVPVA